MNQPTGMTTLIGESPAFLTIMEAASSAAPLDRPVLVVGERGTGKELIANRLHYLSTRWDGPLVKVNCAALPESLLETELFGHEAGAFTGAIKRRAGRFERAHRGTLFLDEINSASRSVQEKILRVVEYGEFERIGSTETTRVDVRIVAASNIDLPAAADAGDFRHDLLDRLAFDVLTVPPLRERTEDITLLARHFGGAMAADLGWPSFPGFTDRALKEMLAYGWPGNVREIRNVSERSVFRWDDPGAPVDTIIIDPFASPWRPAPVTITAAAQPRPYDQTAQALALSGDLKGAVDQFEKDLLERTLRAQRYNQRAAAVAAGLTYHQFRNRLKKHGLLEHPRAGLP